MSDKKTTRRRVQTPVGKVSRVKQSFREECDVNAIIRRHLAGQPLDHVNSAESLYGDVSSIEDYHASINRVKAAEERFARLPAHVRDYCGNNPARLVEMALDPDCHEKLRELGVLPPVQAETESAAEPTPEITETAPETE